jgi:hypothetical protein
MAVNRSEAVTDLVVKALEASSVKFPLTAASWGDIALHRNLNELYANFEKEYKDNFTALLPANSPLRKDQQAQEDYAEYLNRAHLCFEAILNIYACLEDEDLMRLTSEQRLKELNTLVEVVDKFEEAFSQRKFRKCYGQFTKAEQMGNFLTGMVSRSTPSATNEPTANILLALKTRYDAALLKLAEWVEFSLTINEIINQPKSALEIAKDVIEHLEPKEMDISVSSLSKPEGVSSPSLDFLELLSPECSGQFTISGYEEDEETGALSESDSDSQHDNPQNIASAEKMLHEKQQMESAQTPPLLSSPEERLLSGDDAMEISSSILEIGSKVTDFYSAAKAFLSFITGANTAEAKQVRQNKSFLWSFTHWLRGTEEPDNNETMKKEAEEKFPRIVWEKKQGEKVIEIKSEVPSNRFLQFFSKPTFINLCSVEKDPQRGAVIKSAPLVAAPETRARQIEGSAIATSSLVKKFAWNNPERQIPAIVINGEDLSCKDVLTMMQQLAYQRIAFKLYVGLYEILQSKPQNPYFVEYQRFLEDHHVTLVGPRPVGGTSVPMDIQAPFTLREEREKIGGSSEDNSPRSRSPGLRRSRDDDY